MEWYYVWWPWLTSKRVARFVNDSWVSFQDIVFIRYMAYIIFKRNYKYMAQIRQSRKCDVSRQNQQCYPPQTDRASGLVSQKYFGQGRGWGRPCKDFLSSSLIMQNLFAVSHIVFALVCSKKHAPSLRCAEFGRYRSNHRYTVVPKNLWTPGPRPCDGARLT